MGQTIECAGHAGQARRCHGNGDGPRVQAAEKGRDEFQARRQHQQDGTAVALTCGLDGRGNGTRPHVEAAVRAELGIFRFSVGKKTERRRVGVAQGFFTDAVDDGDEGIISGLACRTGTLRRHVSSFSGWARAKGIPWARRTDRRKAPVMQTGSGYAHEGAGPLCRGVFVLAKCPGAFSWKLAPGIQDSRELRRKEQRRIFWI